MPALNSELTQRILNLTAGDHLCLFYDKDPAEQMPALIPFIQDGLAKGEQFVYVADDQTVGELAGKLAQGGVAVDEARTQGRLKLWTRQEWRRPGDFSPAQQLATLRQLVEDTLAAGFKGVRFAFEMTWTLGPDLGIHQIEQWEAALSTVFVPGYPGRMICQYNRSRFSPEVLQSALHTHQHAILGDQLCANFFYQAPLILSHGERAQGGETDRSWSAARVEWMIAQLKRVQPPAAGKREETLRPESGSAKTDAAWIRTGKLLDGIHDGCVTLDAAWRFTHVNEAAARMLGKPAKELLGKTYGQESPALLGGRVEQACRSAMTEQMSVEFDDVLLPGGRRLGIKAYPISPGEICLCLRDTKEPKPAAETAAASPRDLKARVEELRPLDELGGGRSPIPDMEPLLREVLRAALMVDGADMGLLSLGDPHRPGLRTGVSSGLGPDFLQISEFIPPGVGACGACYRQRETVIIEDVTTDPLFVRYRETAKVGGFRAVHSTPLTTRDNRVVGVLSVYFREPHRPTEREIRLTDLYARQAADCIENFRLLGEISQARDAAEQASQAKDNFLAALSHELRAPLNPVLLLASEGAGNPELSAEVREDFSSIARNVTLEARLIDDLLDLTGISKGKRASEMRALDLHDILQEALVNVRPELERKRIALTLSLRAKQHTVMGDPVRLQQVFWNVLSNAAKFTSDKGLVSLETRIIPTKGVVAVTIVDTGVGMTSDELGAVFTAFAQGPRPDRHAQPRPGGMGIGLAHSRLLVELHGGTIRAFSAGRDQGATFVVELPLARVESSSGGSPSAFLTAGKPPVNARSDASGRPCRILLVEDHEPTRIALAKLLARRRYDVSTAGSVAEAIALAGRKDFDLLVADIGLPDADGYELMATLRERHGLKGIAVTGYGMEQDLARSKAAGFVAHLTKPVSAQTFEQALAAAAR